MGWRITADLEEFAEGAGDFLREDAVENTVLLSVAENLRVRGADAYGSLPPLFGWWRSAVGGRVGGAFLFTRPMPVLASTMTEEAARGLADALGSRVDSVPGINAEPSVAYAFGSAWQRRTGLGNEVKMNQRLHRLGRLEVPDPAPSGAARSVRVEDVELVLFWLESFERDIGVPATTSRAMVMDQIGYEGFVLWETDGVPVSLAGRTRVIADVARVSAVYTPIPYRGNGFAAAVTATVAQNALDAGAGEVVLFTDLANPTSNGVYRRIGFRPVSDRLLLHFTPAAV